MNEKNAASMATGAMQVPVRILSPWTVFAALMWRAWMPLRRRVLGLLVAWTVLLWVLPLFHHPGWLIAFGLIYVLLVAEQGGADVADGTEEFAYSLPPTRGMQYAARMLVGLVPLLGMCAAGSAAIALELPRRAWAMVVETGLTEPYPAIAMPAPYWLAVAFPGAFYVFAHVLAAASASAAGVRWAWLVGMLIAVALLPLGYAVEHWALGGYSGRLTAVILAVSAVVAIVVGYMACVGKPVVKRPGPGEERRSMGWGVAMAVLIIVLLLGLTGCASATADDGTMAVEEHSVWRPVVLYWGPFVIIVLFAGALITWLTERASRVLRRWRAHRRPRLRRTPVRILCAVGAAGIALILGIGTWWVTGQQDDLTALQSPRVPPPWQPQRAPDSGRFIHVVVVFADRGSGPRPVHIIEQELQWPQDRGHQVEDRWPLDRGRLKAEFRIDHISSQVARAADDEDEAAREKTSKPTLSGLRGVTYRLAGSRGGIGIHSSGGARRKGSFAPTVEWTMVTPPSPYRHHPLSIASRLRATWTVCSWVSRIPRETPVDRVPVMEIIDEQDSARWAEKPHGTDAEERIAPLGRVLDHTGNITMVLLIVAVGLAAQCFARRGLWFVVWMVVAVLFMAALDRAVLERHLMHAADEQAPIEQRMVAAHEATTSLLYRDTARRGLEALAADEQTPAKLRSRIAKLLSLQERRTTHQRDAVSAPHHDP